ncbi:phosphoribosylglycinamide formyltransferase [Arcobacter sp. FWKO B]|uniref:phosphoribosylglycinamide formyltransferase n=1 Tax=Arcobacter sp. FWKO B TaxID=2593672 RepID=UPI001D184950|nr:phosphoribosylglycinamide formyltransferase [Arcobacter sp. FWKO B]
MNLAILASHNGSILDYIYNSIQTNVLDITVSVVITNNSNALVIEKAKKYNIPYYVVNSKLYPDTNLDEKILNILHSHNTEYILLAGYMKKIGDVIINSYQNKIINSHPALLPKYGGVGMYGKFVHMEVLKNKEKISGVTIHYVNNHYDEGEIILQRSMRIAPHWDVDELEANIKKLESDSVIQVLRQIASYYYSKKS